MRILIPSFVFGRSGGHRVLSELANAWLAKGHDVTFLVPATGGDPYFPTDARILRVDGGGICEGDIASGTAPHNGVRSAFNLYKGMDQVGRDYDVILLNHSFTVLPGVLARTGSAKLVYYIQAYEPDYYLGQPLNWLMAKMSYYLPVTRIVNAPIYRRYKGIRAEHVVPPGIDIANYHPKPAVEPDAYPTRLLGCIGRSEPEKGTRYVLEAFEALAALDPRYRLRVAYGNLPAGWSHPRAEIVVPANDRELADFYRSVDIMIAPGTVQHGAVHYPVLEAMACGTTVVTTGYMPANDQNAWIVKNRDAGSIVSAVREIAEHPALAHAKAHRGIAAVHPFAWSEVSAAMLRIFEEA